jgi:hypothetical protein
MGSSSPQRSKAFTDGTLSPSDPLILSLLCLSCHRLPPSSAAVTESLAVAAASSLLSSSADTQLQLQQQSLLFTLSNEDDFDRYSDENMTIFVSDFLSTDEQACDLNSLPLLSSSASLSGQTFPWGSGLNPFRKPQLLCRDIFEMLTSQMKLISFDSQQKILCESICKSTVLNTLSSKNLSSASASSSASAYGGIDIRMDLWGALDGVPVQSSQGGSLLEEERNRGRSLSPRNRRSRSQGRQANSIGRKGRTNVDSNSPGPAEGTVMDANDSSSNSAAVTAAGGVATNDRRSRSSGPQRSNQRGSSASSSSKLPPKIQTNGKQQSAATGAGAVTPSSSSSLQSQSQCQSQPQRVPSLFSTLKCFPSEINRHVYGTRGPIHGIWITDHPLSSLPSAYYETVSVIDSFPSSLLTENKRAEWELDLMREYDAKRMDRLEEYLMSCRRNIEEQMKYASRRGPGGGTGAGTAGGGGAKK